MVGGLLGRAGSCVGATVCGDTNIGWEEGVFDVVRSCDLVHNTVCYEKHRYRQSICSARSDTRSPPSLKLYNS